LRSPINYHQISLKSPMKGTPWNSKFAKGGIER